MEPLVCVADLVAMGCRLMWTEASCTLGHHPSRGSIPTKVDNKCPEVEVPVARELIKDVERLRMDGAGTAARIRKAMQAALSQDADDLGRRLWGDVRQGRDVRISELLKTSRPLRMLKAFPKGVLGIADVAVRSRSRE